METHFALVKCEAARSLIAKAQALANLQSFRANSLRVAFCATVDRLAELSHAVDARSIALLYGGVVTASGAMIVPALSES